MRYENLRAHTSSDDLQVAKQTLAEILQLWVGHVLPGITACYCCRTHTPNGQVGYVQQAGEQPKLLLTLDPLPKPCISDNTDAQSAHCLGCQFHLTGPFLVLLASMCRQGWRWPHFTPAKLHLLMPKTRTHSRGLAPN